MNKELIQKIEDLRQALYLLISVEQELTSDTVVKYSQKLDELLNKFNSLN